MEKIRLGILGLGRGGFVREYCSNINNAELVAVCDLRADALESYKKDGIECFTDFDEFVKKPDMDAVMIANYANKHAQFCIKAMRAGKHVISEVLPFQTLKEGIELIETVEETGMTYAYGENYAFMPCNREMRRLFLDGTLGTFEYGEGEYFHNCEPGWEGHTNGYQKDHWRNLMYSTFYCTHSIGPIIHISRQRPVKVTGFELPYNLRAERMGYQGAPAAIEMIELESGALIKSAHGVAISRNSYWFGCYGSKGRAECAREATGGSVNNTKLYLNADEYEGQNIELAEKMYYPAESDKELSKIAQRMGHGGGDFLMVYNFIEHLLGHKGEIIDIYEACDMFLPGMFAYRSILAGGVPMDIPNFRNKAERDKWREDTACVDPNVAGDMLLPSRKGLKK